MNPIEFLGEFQAEAGEKLDVIASHLLRLERDPGNSQPVREMFLAAHTIKGGAAMLRLTDVEALAHALEDLLSALRDSQRTLDPGTADLLFQSLDHLRQLLAAASAEAIGAEADPRLAAFTERLRAAATGEPLEAVVAEPVELPAPAEPLAEPVAPVEHVTLPTAERPRALVVDDSATVRALHSLLLEELGYRVETVQDGQVAFSRALEVPFAVVVAGLQTRGLNGFQLASALRAQPAYQGVPIVLMSADADAVLTQRAVEAGASVLLRKGSWATQQLSTTLAGLAAARAG